MATEDVYLPAFCASLSIALMGENERTTWDDPKNELNINRRAIDFSGLQDAFDGRFSLVREDKRHDYGERRYNMLVELNAIVFNITFTPRGRKQRIVSARLANRRERKLYEQEKR